MNEGAVEPPVRTVEMDEMGGQVLSLEEVQVLVDENPSEDYVGPDTFLESFLVSLDEESE